MSSPKRQRMDDNDEMFLKVRDLMDGKDTKTFTRVLTSTNEQRQRFLAKTYIKDKRLEDIAALQKEIQINLGKLAESEGKNEEISMELSTLVKIIKSHRAEIAKLDARKEAKIEVTETQITQEITLTLSERMKSTKATKTIVLAKDVDFNIDACAICTNPLKDRCMTTCEALGNQGACDTMKGECGHIYHGHCITNWLKKHEICPLDDEIWLPYNADIVHVE